MSYWKVLLEKWKAFICNKKRKGKNGLFYIGGSDTLPPPLSAEEEQQAVRAFMGGSKKARDLLIEHNLRLVVYIARKLSLIHIWWRKSPQIGAANCRRAELQGFQTG